MSSDLALEGSGQAPDDVVLPGLPEPHALIPRATARKGTRRMLPEVSAVIGKQLSRDRAAELAASGELDPARCQVVWNVGGRPVKQPVTRVITPDPRDLQAVKRIGSYKAAVSLIGMVPVVRGLAVTMVETESQLELHHAIELLLNEHLTDLLGQPFLMVWTHDEGNLVHIPDLATIVDGRLKVYDVKPDHRAAEERVRLMFDLVRRTLRCGHIEFEVLGSMSKQRQVNLTRLGRYRWPASSLEGLAQMVRGRTPRTIGGVLRVTREHLGLEGGVEVPGPDCPSLIAIDATCYALARGWARTDLDRPLGWASPLSWDAAATTADPAPQGVTA